MPHAGCAVLDQLDKPKVPDQAGRVTLTCHRLVLGRRSNRAADQGEATFSEIWQLATWVDWVDWWSDPPLKAWVLPSLSQGEICGKFDVRLLRRLEDLDQQIVHVRQWLQFSSSKAI
jgi:hypothetical protein